MKKLTIVVGTVIALMSCQASAVVISRSAPVISRPTLSYRPAAPTYRTPVVAPRPAPTVIQKNVTVHQSVTNVTTSQGAHGGGFFSSFLGSVAGSSLAQWLFTPKQPQAAVPSDCAIEQNKTLAVCQPQRTN